MLRRIGALERGAGAMDASRYTRVGRRTAGEVDILLMDEGYQSTPHSSYRQSANPVLWRHLFCAAVSCFTTCGFTESGIERRPRGSGAVETSLWLPIDRSAPGRGNY